MKQDDINKLLDKAAQNVGSDYKVAQSLGVPRQQVSAWRHGKKTFTPEDAAQVAYMGGLDGGAWALRAMVERHEGTAKGDRLLKAVGKALLVTGATIGSAGAMAAATSSQAISYFIRCIVLLSCKPHPA